MLVVVGRRMGRGREGEMRGENWFEGVGGFTMRKLVCCIHTSQI